MPRRGPSPTPFGEVFNRNEDRRRFDDRRDTRQEDIDRDFRRDDRERQDDRRDLSREMMELRLSNDELREVINSPTLVMDDNGLIAELPKRKKEPVITATRMAKAKPLGSGRFARQFNQGMGFNFSQLSEPKPKRKVSSASKRYGRAFKQVAPRFKLKSGRWKKNGFRSAVRAAHKLAKTNLKL